MFILTRLRKATENSATCLYVKSVYKKQLYFLFWQCLEIIYFFKCMHKIKVSKIPNTNKFIGINLTNIDSNPWGKKTLTFYWENLQITKWRNVPGSWVGILIMIKIAIPLKLSIDSKKSPVNNPNKFWKKYGKLISKNNIQ